MFVSKAHEATATLAALNCSHAVIAFKMDGTILTANENFLAVTGYRLADIRGRSHAIFIAVRERHGIAYQRFWDGLKRGEFQAGEYAYIGKHGREVWLQATYHPILRPNGKPFLLTSPRAWTPGVTAVRPASRRRRSCVAGLGRSMLPARGGNWPVGGPEICASRLSEAAGAWPAPPDLWGMLPPAKPRPRRQSRPVGSGMWST